MAGVMVGCSTVEHPYLGIVIIGRKTHRTGMISIGGI